MADYVSSIKEDSLKQFFIKVNEDPSFRIKFLANPLEILASEGIRLNSKAQEEVKSVTNVLLQKLPRLSVIPTGFEPLLEEVSDINRERIVSKERLDKPEILIL